MKNKSGQFNLFPRVPVLPRPEPNQVPLLILPHSELGQ